MTLNFFDIAETTAREYTEEDRKKETEMFNQHCGSCVYFSSFYAEAGFCAIAKNNCICKNPKAIIDIWDKKCDKWKEND